MVATAQVAKNDLMWHETLPSPVVASLIGFLLTLAIAAWELKIGLIAYNMDHVHDKLNMYYNDGTQHLLKYSGITLLSFANLKVLPLILPV